MKRRITPILTITVGLILFSSLAYAAKKKEQAKAVVRTPDEISEEIALKAELLDATEGQQKNLSIIDNMKKNVDAGSGENSYQLKSSMQVDMR